jgi:Cell wall-active antibiotics response 4TMS YvqF
VRFLRRLLLVELGFWSGVAASAAILKRVLPSSGDAASDELALVAIFDGIDLANRSTSFRGGSLLTWFGGIQLDLRQAQLAAGAYLRAHALWGGIAIQVPPEWNVESRARGIAGGVAVDPARSEGPEAPVLVVDGFALLGGIAIGREDAS